MKKIILSTITIFTLLLPKSYANEEFLKDGNNFSSPGYVYHNANKKADSNELIENSNDNKIVPYFVPWDFNRSLSVPYRRQINGYYCGPASVQMVVDYYKHNPDKDQNYYASKLGTTKQGTAYDMIEKVLNEHIWSYKYDVYMSNNNFQDFLDSAYYSIKNRAPIVVNMRSDVGIGKGSWIYSVSGHYIVVSSMRYDSSMKKFVGDIKDPWHRNGQYQETYPHIFNVMLANKGVMIH
ncbi:C39 family peptidase [Anaerococcus sp. mt242]|uniref:C39 family peptidase n=1 Tax=Anaerococcus sp. mt242 TaxID=2661917 RepID=UPI0019324CB5|nr:C39 family peptidase [Anaerococcus sp. mt242]MBM0046205.1 C39 family peptidase [Anaerococcus sp. mt242]